VYSIGDTWDILLALLDDRKSENREIHSDDATTDGLALTLTGAAGSVARVALAEKETDTSWVHNTLLHWETLLVVTAGNSEDVALEFVTNGVTWDLSSHTPMILLEMHSSTVWSSTCSKGG
jgi:hypothetical protein